MRLRQGRTVRILFALIGMLLSPPAQADAVPTEHEEFFERSIRPILVGRCLECHGAKKQESGLRLDSREGMVQGGDRGPAFNVDDPGKSLFLTAIHRRDDLEMPPEEPLGQKEVESLAHWIELGAPWPARDEATKGSGPAGPHWAFEPVRRPPLPDAPPGTVAENEIDLFLASARGAKGITESPLADRRTLARRASYDLTGLPPTGEEIEAFAEDESADAYERMLDRLLASPHHGERWARHWLDVARYSDTKGYVYAREERFWLHAWAYRDWVVQALNADMPYDRFVLLQLAADQLGTTEDLPAMGYLTLGRRFLGVTHDIIDDRIDVTTRGLLGLTVACARCHDHKFDPIPTKDYYSLYGVFKNGVERLGDLRGGEEDQPEGEAFRAGLEERQKKLDETMARRRREAADRARARVADYLLAQLEMEKYPEEGFDQVLQATDLIPATVRRWRDYLARGDENVFAPWRAFAALPAERFEEESPRVASELRAQGELPERVASLLDPPPKSMRELAERYGAMLVEVRDRWKAKLEVADAPGTSAPISSDDPEEEKLRQVLYGIESPCEPPDEMVIDVEWYVTTDVCVELWKLQGDVDRWIIQSPLPVYQPVVLVDRQHPTETRVFRRGNPAQATDVAPRRFLELFVGKDAPQFKQGSGRAELAEAITNAGNPLTGRVLVNRVWSNHFGAGLVRTPSDFGRRAEAPSHPELLDWLASDFVEEGWGLKRLHRQMMTTRAYRLSSEGPASPEARETARVVDPENRLLGHANRRRLSFEEMRDSILSASESLDSAMGGKPASLFAEPAPTRRTLYGLVDREFFPTVLRAFDFANPDLHIPQRSETTVPQQSLFFLNHPIVVAAAEKLARRVEDVSSDEEAVDVLYRAVLRRSASAEELQLAVSMLQSGSAEPTPKPTEFARAWSYGFAKLDAATGGLSGFQPLPHFAGDAWQGGSSYPDGALGWLQLNAKGGHPGNDLDHVVVRRWTAPAAGTIAVEGKLVHEPDDGNGIRGGIFSSRQGWLKVATVRHGEVEMSLGATHVDAGETIDFVVDIHGELRSDQFLWAPVLKGPLGEAQEDATWDAARDFGPDRPPAQSPRQRLAQVLLMTNEFVFVD